MPFQPQPHWDILNGELCWTIDWRDLFRSGVKIGNPFMSGEMRGFHIVFRLRVREGGRLVFWADDGCVIRHNGRVVHDDRMAHPPVCNEIEVEAGDYLEVAQWQLMKDWLWGARLSQPGRDGVLTAADVLEFYLEEVQERLRHPEGPPLKYYTDGRTPVRVVAALYSLILQGYAPSAVYLFGENQWSGSARELFARLLPFAQVIPNAQVVSRVRSVGGTRLVDLAQHYWFVMKTCVSLLCPPEEFCLMDDDVFILDRLDDALAAFEKNDLVFIPDQDLSAGFMRTWGVQASGFSTKRFNAGLYWLRQVYDARWLGMQMLRGRPRANESYNWEQGFIAMMYAQRNTLELPGQRYFYPLFDGLPGSMLGYDYAHNPCGFASIHFGGLAEKPSDGVAIHILNQILAHNSESKTEMQAAAAST